MYPEKERMIHVIVVDDEPISADDMAFLIRETYSESKNVTVRTAYNAKTVFRQIEEIPCDILISDIQMPGTTGLEMVKKIRETSPHIRVIFLTGFDDFSYAYEAFRQKAVQYILKTEGDERVLHAIEQEIKHIRENEKIYECINDAENRYTQMVPAYRRQLVMQMMLNQKHELDEFEKEMLQGNLYLVYAQLQGENSRNVATKLQAATAITGIVSKAFGEELSWTEHYLFDDALLWVFCYTKNDSISKTLFHLMRKARERLEEQLRLTLFFVVSEDGVSGEKLDEKYVEIRAMFTNEIMKGSAGVAIRHVEHGGEKYPENAKIIANLRRSLENIQILFRKGSVSDAREDINFVIEYLEKASIIHNLVAVEAAQSLNASLLSYINQNGMISLVIEAEKSGNMGSTAYFRKLQELLMQETEKRIDNAVKSIAESVASYINHHISEDLSSQVLSDITGYSSGYLSRIFKQQMNTSIHEYVSTIRMNLAKEMLANTNLKIYEIAANCGYENTTYFIKTFKMATGMTPQDYKLSIG